MDRPSSSLGFRRVQSSYTINTVRNRLGQLQTIEFSISLSHKSLTMEKLSDFTLSNVVFLSSRIYFIIRQNVFLDIFCNNRYSITN